MSSGNEKLRTLFVRPIDCHPKHISLFAKIVLAGGEVPIENLRRGIPSAEMLFFSGISGITMGVNAVRFANSAYHKHLFERAGVPKMYNPHSVESCWLSVLTEHQGKGVWKDMIETRQNYLGNRPSHAVRRADNQKVNDPDRLGEYTQVGEEFYTDTSDDKLILLVNNHDPILDKSKRLQYV